MAHLRVLHVVVVVVVVVAFLCPSYIPVHTRLQAVVLNAVLREFLNAK